MMKKKCLRMLILALVSLLLLTPAKEVCPQEVVFMYDECGNRISEEIIVLKDLTAENGKPGFKNWESVHFADAKNVRISITPNPTGGPFTVHLENLKPGNDARLELHNIYGEIILDKKNLSSTNQIDIDRQRKGTYVLSIIIDGIRKTRKVIKQ
jgi:hypothetical protein